MSRARRRWWELASVQALLAVGGLLGLVLGGVELLDRLTADNSRDPPATAEQSAIAHLGCTADTAGSVPVQGGLGVANVTSEDTDYAGSIWAEPGDIVQFQMWVHNRSLTDDVENLRVRLLAPTLAQQSHIVEMQACGSNTRLVRHSVTIHTNVSDLALVFVDGTSNIRTAVEGGQAYDRGGSDTLFNTEGESLGRLEASIDPSAGQLTVAVRATLDTTAPLAPDAGP